jgi:pyruvate dehydrogenase E2 component (dihydrolipoamide acetyltransferase)
VSVNDFVVKAAALALRDVPAANASWDVASQAARAFSGVDICVAVATERGLVTPIVAGADRLSLMDISRVVKDLASRARDNKLKPEEFMGGSFTISNLGMFGISNFSAIINPPQACILAVGGAQQRVSLVGGRPVASSVMGVTLSADNRVVDGEQAAEFLAAFGRYLANPLQLVV